MRDDKAQFESGATAMLGINPGSMASHQKFCDKLDLPFLLLVDADRSVAQAYGAVKENGKSILRSVVIVDKTGTIQYIKRGLPPDQELLDSIGKM